ncbi:hypothetical protein GCM10009838_38220 [Catenulispora subtropica]|uniref:Transmembrane transport protein n=2 Tax=Catenulispora subtropica TaxID=450798 RepID=A0ABN2RTC5_9ACTN
METGEGFMRGLIWLTWRQHRWPILASAVLTAGLATWMLVTTSRLRILADQCPAASCEHGGVDKTASFASYQMNVVAFLPVLVAVFWGVPLLAREFEQRTLPLAWSQDVSRQKWLLGKSAMLTVLIAAMAAVLAGVVARMAHAYHLYTGDSLFEGSAFQAGGWLPLTLAPAWLAFGIAAGAATRRVLPGIAVVGAAWVGRMSLMPHVREDGFMAPAQWDRPIRSDDLPGAKPGDQGGIARIPENGMSVSSHPEIFVDAQGKHYTGHDIDLWCGTGPQNAAPGSKIGKGGDFADCLNAHHIVAKAIEYQPASRMGTFHLMENGLNLGLFAASLLFAWWCVRRARTTTV